MELKEIGNKKYLGKGACAKCYVLEDGTVFKKFNSPLRISDIDRFRYFLQYKNESFLFPFEFIYDNKKFYGYINKKADGIILKKSFSSSNLENLSKNSINLERDINYISEGKIVIHDLNSENIMYDEKKLEVIDPDEYGIRYGATIDDIKNINLDKYRKRITNLFLVNLPSNKNTKYIIDLINKHKYSDAKVSDIILDIKHNMESYYKENVESIDDVREIIKRSKNG